MNSISGFLGISRKPARFLLAAGLTGLLSGCGANVHHVEVGAIPDDYRTNHPIIVSEQEQTLDVPVASSDGDLRHGMESAIRGYARNYTAGASGAITILVPHGSMNAAAAALVARDVKSVLVEEGVPAGRIIVSGYGASATGDVAPIRLSYFAIDASTGECGRWPEDMLANGNENKHYANFGCATQNNLAAQVANPMDLLAPRAVSPIDSERRQNVIADYQDGGSGL